MATTIFYNKPVPFKKDMCDNVSEMIVRANPKLSTNAKLMTNGDFVMLESFDSCKETSYSKYKNVRTYDSSKYNFDLAKFWKNTDKMFAYSVLQEFDNTTTKDSFERQYETFYWSGCEYIDSLEYNESFGFLAPLWIDENLPERFVIFRVNDPSYWNFVFQNDSDVRDLDFEHDILDKCEIVKTFDLTENSRLGKYIRRYCSQEGFPESPLTMNDEWLSFNGISYSTGEFISVKEQYAERFWKHDETVLEFDKYITEGFERNGVVVANLLNLEFLFDDEKANQYEFTRYFGLYCNVIYDGKFDIDKENLYNLGNVYDFNINDYDIYKSGEFIASNALGVNIPATMDFNELSPIFSTTSSMKSVFFVEDIDGQLHSISRTVDSGSQHVFRMCEQNLNLGKLKGFVEKVDSVTCTYEDNTTCASMCLTIESQIPHYAKLQVFNRIGGVDLPVGEMTSISNASTECGSWIYDMFVGDGDTEHIAKSICGSFNELFDIGIKAYTYKNNVYFISTNASPAYNTFGIKLIDCADDQTDCIKMSNFGMLFGSNKYEHVKCEESLVDTFAVGDFLPSRAHNGYSKIVAIVPDYDNAKIDGNEITFPNGKFYDILLDSAGVYAARTNVTKIYERFKPKFGRLSFYPVKDLEMSTYHDTTKYGDKSELDYEMQCVINGGISSNDAIETITGLSLDELSFSFDGITFFIDFDTDGQVIIDSHGNAYSVEVSGPNANDEFTVSICLIIENSMFMSSTSQSLEGSFLFDTLSTNLNVPMLTYLKSEYDRCHENLNPNLMLLSKTQPWICNWVLKNGVDVREKPYRLNSNPVFGQYSFTPDTTDYEPTPVHYNQEWLYIMDQPLIRTISGSIVDQRKVWSYIGESVDSIQHSANENTVQLFEDRLRSVDENWFDVYFKRDHIVTGVSDSSQVDYNYFSTPEYKLKYSILHNGSDNTVSETFFRGAKIEFLMKSDWDEILDNNLDTIKVKYGVDLNGYKFSAVCVPISVTDGTSISDVKTKVIRNDKFKTITLIQYLVRNYDDALDCFMKKANPNLQPTKMELKKVTRYEMYNASTDEDNAKTHKPITIKGKGKIMFSNNLVQGPDDPIAIYGENTSFVSDFATYNEKDANFYDENGTHTYYKELLMINSPLFVDTTPSEIKYLVVRIENVYSDTYMTGKIRTISDNVGSSTSYFDVIDRLNVLIHQNHWGNIQPWTTNMSPDLSSYYIVNCDYEQFSKNFNKCVFASIKHTVNHTQKEELVYELVNEDGTVVSSNDNKYPFALKFIEPLENAKYEYMSLFFDGELVTYGILPSHAAPMYRYTGKFTPLRNDVLYFTDPYIEDFAMNPNLSNSKKIKFFTESRHLNTCFDTTISDFGIIHDFAFHRTNENNSNIFKLAIDEKPLYPTSNRFAIGKRDVQVFNSSWDPWYFTRTMSNTLENECHGTLSMKENKAFFGSKCLTVPNEFKFETFSNEELNGDEIQTSDVLFSEKQSHVEMFLNIENKLAKALCSSLHDMFSEYIDEQYSYGDKTTIDDDVERYVRLNLLKLYQVNKVSLWVKKESASREPYIIWEGLLLDDGQKEKDRLSETRVSGITSIPGNAFDRKVVMNTKSGMKYTIGLSVEITRK